MLLPYKSEMVSRQTGLVTLRGHCRKVQAYEPPGSQGPQPCDSDILFTEKELHITVVLRCMYVPVTDGDLRGRPSTLGTSCPLTRQNMEH
jgi:hypothetical protein